VQDMESMKRVLVAIRDAAGAWKKEQTKARLSRPKMKPKDDKAEMKMKSMPPEEEADDDYAEEDLAPTEEVAAVPEGEEEEDDEVKAALAKLRMAK
jgi:hypothetical protein